MPEKYSPEEDLTCKVYVEIVVLIVISDVGNVGD